jgi:hypothetical protein
MPGRKGLVVRPKRTRPVHHPFYFYRRPWASDRDFDPIGSGPGKGGGRDHTEKNYGPTLVPAPPGDSGKQQTGGDMDRPVSRARDRPIQLLPVVPPMGLLPLVNRVVRLKSCIDQSRSKKDGQSPNPEPALILHE